MWKYEKRLQYPINIKKKDLRMAKCTVNYDVFYIKFYIILYMKPHQVIIYLIAVYIILINILKVFIRPL